VLAGWSKSTPLGSGSTRRSTSSGRWARRAVNGEVRRPRTARRALTSPPAASILRAGGTAQQAEPAGRTRRGRTAPTAFERPTVRSPEASGSSPVTWAATCRWPTSPPGWRPSSGRKRRAPTGSGAGRPLRRVCSCWPRRCGTPDRRVSSRARLAVTSTSVFLSASVTTNGIAVCAAVLFATAGMGPVRGRADWRTWLLWAAGGTGLALSAPGLGPVLAVGQATAHLLVMGRDRALSLVRTSPSAATAAVVTVAAATSGAAWTMTTLPAPSLSVDAAADAAPAATGLPPRALAQGVAHFAWGDQPSADGGLRARGRRPGVVGCWQFCEARRGSVPASSCSVAQA
jgi:hypothetical protein